MIQTIALIVLGGIINEIIRFLVSTFFNDGKFINEEKELTFTNSYKAMQMVESYINDNISSNLLTQALIIQLLREDKIEDLTRRIDKIKEGENDNDIELPKLEGTELLEHLRPLIIHKNMLSKDISRGIEDWED